jgi:hypothetical protein
MKMYPWFKHHTMKSCNRVEVKLNTFLTLALDGGKWSASHAVLPPGKEPLVTTE